MKDILKLVLILLFGAIGAAIPVTCFYLLWSWCMVQVPVALAYAGLVKIGITLAMVLVGGSFTVGLTILGAVAAGGLAAMLAELMD